MSKNRKSILDGLLYFLNVLFALALLLSYLAYYVPPSITSVFSFFALAYPVWLLVNIGFAIYWLIKLKVKILLPILCIAIGYLHLSRTYQFGSPKKVVNTEDRLKVMSYNVRMLNQYKWIDEENIDSKIYKLISDVDPDVLLIQEYRENWKEKSKTLDYPYSHFKVSKWGRYGTVIYSKYPITESKRILIKGDSSENNEFHYVDVKWKNSTIRFINVHLASVGLENADYEVLENPEKEKQTEIEKGLKAIVTNLRHAFKRRAIQIDAITETIRDSPYPVVLAGDFNDVPQSYVYHQVDLELEDSFTESGHGFGKTYVRSPVPLRIDFIFHSPKLRAFNHKVIKKELSDHYPVITDLEWK